MNYALMYMALMSLLCYNHKCMIRLEEMSEPKLTNLSAVEQADIFLLCCLSVCMQMIAKIMIVL